MGLRDRFKDKRPTLSDKDILNDLIKDSKFGLLELAIALSECTNPQLRQLLISQFNRCVNDHHALTDLALKKDWYPFNTSPSDQIQIDLAESEKTLS
jgi:similar to spore coat protein